MQVLSKRLQSVADLVCRGERVADIGTDHGYVPVYLVKNNIIPCAIASDVNQGPLSSCSFLVSQEHLDNKIKCVLSNGFDALDSKDFDTAIIAGMGGELIAQILSKCNYINQKKLILNPMTHPEKLRRWLYDNEFCIDKDLIIPDGKHHYSVIEAHYCPTVSNKSDYDCFLGEIEDFSDKEYFLHLVNYLKNKEKSGEDYSDLIKKIEDLI